jgi:hypothetical protein
MVTVIDKRVEEVVPAAPQVDKDAARRLIGLPPRLMAEAVELAGSEDLVLAKYARWKAGVLAAVGGRRLSRAELAEALGTNTDFLAQLKLRRMLTWTEVSRSGAGSGFVFTLADVVALFELSENWLRGGSEVVGGQGTKGPLAHLFLAWLRAGGGSAGHA